MGDIMDPADFPEADSFINEKEILISNGNEQEALMNLLEKRAIITRAELPQEMKILRDG